MQSLRSRALLLRRKHADAHRDLFSLPLPPLPLLSCSRCWCIKDRHRAFSSASSPSSSPSSSSASHAPTASSCASSSPPSSSSSSSSSPSSASTSSSSSPILFLIGKPGSGKGTQSRLLIREFGARLVSGLHDGTEIEEEVMREIDRRFPIGTGSSSSSPSPSSSSSSSPSSSSSLRFELIHLSIGALLRREMSHVPSSPLAESIRVEIARGGIVTGEITVQLLKEEMRRLRELHARLFRGAAAEEEEVQEKKDRRGRGEREEKTGQREQQPPTLVFLIDGFPRSLDNVHHFQSHIGSLRAMALLECSDETLRRRIARRAERAREKERQRQDDAEQSSSETRVSSARNDDEDAVVSARLVTYQSVTRPVLEWWNSAAPLSSSSSRAADSSAASQRQLYRVDGEPDIVTVYSTMREAYLAFLDFTMRDTNKSLAANST